jgi:glutathione S-transferase
MVDLTVVTFNPAWGLPTTGPFALKLLKWLDLAGVPYRQRFEERAEKGPKGKNPWIELEGERIGDTEIIIALLAKRHGFDIDAGLPAGLLGRNHAIRRMVEEHFHQVLEWELFVHPAGRVYVREAVGRLGIPSLVGGLVAASVCGHFERQLKARGIGRHSPELIAQKGIADLDALADLLADTPFFGGNRPAMADIAVYGLLAPMAKWPMRTPVAEELKRRPKLIGFVERMIGATAGPVGS